ncbi:hypothetical protein A2U01_0067665 [Trifolium medium]|uniref:Uncharacterized protein n=1 Tax=Trifolium medium TaxID=97028 RepID=A0A392SEV0_9FABA|nr:hypothetical protein [Trifolium medium]
MSQTQQQNSPLRNLEAHLQGALPPTPQPKLKPVFKDPSIPTIEDLSLPEGVNQTIPTTRVFDNIFSSLENISNPNIDYVIRTPDP